MLFQDMTAVDCLREADKIQAEIERGLRTGQFDKTAVKDCRDMVRYWQRQAKLRSKGK